MYVPKYTSACRSINYNEWFSYLENRFVVSKNSIIKISLFPGEIFCIQMDWWGELGEL